MRREKYIDLETDSQTSLWCDLPLLTTSRTPQQLQPIIHVDDNVERIAFDNELELLKWFFKSVKEE